MLSHWKGNKMYTFKSFISESNYIIEATSVDDEALGHLTHVKDLPHEDARHSKMAVDLLRDFHNKRQGKPSSIGASLKTDGGASVHVIHDEHGVGVSDKHRMARGVVARTPEEVDKHFGHAPEYAESLKHVLKHAHEFVNKGHHIQGDLLHTPNEKPTEHGDKISTTRNRLTYHMKTKAPLGLAVHTEVKGGVARAVSKKALKKTPHVFVPEHEYHADPNTYSAADKKATETHLNAAEALLRNHTSHHLTPEHVKAFTIYNNRSTARGETPTVEGYKKHLHDEGEKAANKLKTEAGKTKTRAAHAAMIAHVDQNAHHFQRSLDIRHHLEQATEHVLKGVKHPDMETSLDGHPSQGEGIVLQKEGRPVGKLVPKAITRAIINNPRFGRG